MITRVRLMGQKSAHVVFTRDALSQTLTYGGETDKTSRVTGDGSIDIGERQQAPDRRQRTLLARWRQTYSSERFRVALKIGRHQGGKRRRDCRAKTDNGRAIRARCIDGPAPEPLGDDHVII